MAIITPKYPEIEQCAICSTKDLMRTLTMSYKLKNGLVRTRTYTYKSTFKNSEGKIICQTCFLRYTLAEYRISLMRIILSIDKDGVIKCAHCGYDKDVRALAIDHIKGGGAADQKKFGNNHTMYRYYLKHPREARKKLQILCCNCNRIKVHVMKEHGKGGFQPGRRYFKREK